MDVRKLNLRWWEVYRIGSGSCSVAALVLAVLKLRILMLDSSVISVFSAIILHFTIHFNIWQLEKMEPTRSPVRWVPGGGAAGA
jgi:hypothetical protein